ncbi:MAG: PKD domain-containing protein, partial [Thaumarchaeota archaeon]|nr:PKD domain-containing protein [Nitrososphaerota archaeon]
VNANCPNGDCPKFADSITNVNLQPPSGTAPLLETISVTYTTSSSVKQIIWNFGDGTAVTNISNTTSHTYQSAGNYTGSVELDFKDGQDDTKTFQVSVSGGIGANALNATISNPNSGTMNAYQYLLQKYNGSSVATSIPPLSIQTSSPTYNQGDTIVINGAVKNVSNQTAVTVRVMNSLKNLVSIAQLIPSNNGDFSTKVLATGPLWTKAGNYTIIAQYGPATNTTATFYYSGGDGTSTINKSVNGTFALQTPIGTFNIPYTIQGGAIQNIQVFGPQSTPPSTLAITINTSSDGSLSITLPRALIDSKQLPPTPTGPNQTTSQQFNPADMPDQAFTVQDGGHNVQFTEVKNINSRTLGIPFHKGDTTIDIVGTIAVPEFGPIAALALAIAIISIIAVSAKTGLRFMPKY